MEKGVNVWLRDDQEDDWYRAVVVGLSDSSSHNCQVRLRVHEGPQARTETTLSLDIHALENEELTTLLLANNHDMDLVEDLIQLPHLHEPGICHALQKRFEINEIYTFTGEILLAINPFQNVGIYTEKIRRKYIRNGEKRAIGADVLDMPPHVFSVADKAYRNLCSPLFGKQGTTTESQSILVSGESGAGKTESTKFIMEYLATLSKSQKGRMTEQETSVIEKILSSNPILESFGNARTIRNDNSSRFGKFIKLHFSVAGQLIGASIQTYLLEKVRLAYQAETERNYHIFYELLAGSSSEEKKRWYLPSNSSELHYLNQSTCNKRKDGIDDRIQFSNLKKAMHVMGFLPTEIDAILSTIAMLLHLGNLTFDKVVNDESGMDGSKIHAHTKSLQFVSNYFEVDRLGLEQLLCFRKIKAKDDTYVINQSVEDAGNTRDAMARYIYGQLFDWLVDRINRRVECEYETEKHFIGLLDIFGFEDLSHNSFEQLCINYANERLQQHFNRTVLRLEQEMYEREAIEWSFINFPDNSACIDLIQAKPCGILNVLDEECIVPQGNDQNFARKLYRQHADHPHFSADSTHQASHLFVVHHYAAQVVYDTFGFCDKNKDALCSEVVNFIKRSTKPFAASLVKVPSRNKTVVVEGSRRVQASRSAVNNTGGLNRCSLGTQFRNQLKALLDTIGVTSCHYVRCLKPNDTAAPSKFISRRVCDQLRAGGVLEAVRVNRAGYPVRMSHQQFLKRYRPLATGTYLRKLRESKAIQNDCDPSNRKEMAQLLVAFLLRAQSEKYRRVSTNCDEEAQEAASDLACVSGIEVGLTRVFFRRVAIQFVEAQLAKRHAEFIVIIQAIIRGFVQFHRYKRQKSACLRIQSCVRGFLVRTKSIEREKRRRAEADKASQLQKIKDDSLLSDPNQIRTRQSSDPISDDSSDESSRPTGVSLKNAAELNDRGTLRLRFTRDYAYDEDISGRLTLGDRTRSVIMDPGDTVLHVAANCCNAHDVLRLLQNGSDINARNRRDRTPLHTASVHGNVQVVGILLDWDADVLAQDADGNTPLHLARDPKVALMLLEAGCTPNIVNVEGRTTLIDAVDRGDHLIVDALLQFKADVLFRELKHNQTALHLAVRKGHYTIIMALCKSDDAKELILLTDRNGNNVLHFAVSRDRKNGFRLVDFLIKQGAQVDKVNSRFQTPLVVHIMTTRQTDAAITELFLSKRSDPNVSLADGSTLLHIAAERELIDISCMLLQYGAHLNHPDSRGRYVSDIIHRKHLKKLYSAITSPPSWIEPSTRRTCMLCENNFKFGSRRHHCRHCGRVCCGECSTFSVEANRFPKDFPVRNSGGGKSGKDPQRVCRTCHGVFKMRSAQKESKSGFIARVLGYEWEQES
uniref:Myosinlike protein putative n=1 Tax=Albugo laibachii Nc14 TaxID=890382 RepID=F0WJ44_9STRA|nr:myosinlike protein putative [Albugo laibachii Nc14]|eukprot:CCA21290.1 myosinlike protein putative [Albugo laibachii Nc14]